MDADSRALIEDAHQLHELTKHPGWDVLVRRTLEWMRADKQRVLDGTVSGLDDYKKMTGKFVGAHFVMDLPETIRANADRRRERLAEVSQHGGDEAA